MSGGLKKMIVYKSCQITEISHIPNKVDGIFHAKSNTTVMQWLSQPILVTAVPNLNANV